MTEANLPVIWQPQPGERVRIINGPTTPHTIGHGNFRHGEIVSVRGYTSDGHLICDGDNDWGYVSLLHMEPMK